MHLGGEDFDNILLQHCIEQFKIKTRIDLNEDEFKKQKMRLKEHCITAKIELSFKEETDIEVESLVNGKDLILRITRAKLELMYKDIFNECKKPLLEVFELSKENKSNIDEIVLVGGSNRIPKIQSLLKEFFDGKELNKRLNPDEAVLMGQQLKQLWKLENILKILFIRCMSFFFRNWHRRNKIL